MHSYPIEPKSLLLGLGLYLAHFLYVHLRSDSTELFEAGPIVV